MEEENFYEHQGKNNLELNNIFVDRVSYIFKKKIEGERQQVDKKPWADKIAPGNWFSFTNYLQVKQITGNKITVKNQRRVEWELSKDILAQYSSASCFQKVEWITRTEMVEKLSEAKDSAFTAEFRKKVQENEMAQKILAHRNELQDERKLSAVAKDLLDGEPKCMIGRLLKKEKMGRSMIQILNCEGQSLIAQIDHRTLLSLVLRGVKYMLKENQKKKEPEQRCHQEPQVGEWFSKTTYFQVQWVRGNVVGVRDEQNKEFQLEREIVESECESADHFAKDEKLNKGELEETLKDAKDSIMKVAFSKQRTVDECKALLRNLTAEQLDDPKQLKKFCKQILQGEETVLVCNFLGKQSKLGRSMVADLNSPSHDAIRQIDHRTIKSITLRGVCYKAK